MTADNSKVSECDELRDACRMLPLELFNDDISKCDYIASGCNFCFTNIELPSLRPVLVAWRQPPSCPCACLYLTLARVMRLCLWAPMTNKMAYHDRSSGFCRNLDSVTRVIDTIRPFFPNMASALI